ncbi:MAG: tetratricopeptide repeat protein [Candidatus Marinimicrobia bacterium]|nr:tetratricopeptide repeat protein [Candidatus Neomarinimicrobiota bacterium]
MNLKYIVIFPMLFTLMACSTFHSNPKGGALPDFDTMWDYGDPAGTEVKFREILTNVSDQKAPEYKLELKTQIARTLGLQQNFEAALALLDEVEAELKPEYAIARIRYLLERGRTLNSSGFPKESKAYFVEAYELGQKAYADFYTVDAAHMLGIVESPDQQFLWNEIAMARAEKSTDERAQEWLGSLYNNLGWTYHDLGDFEKALEIFQKGRDWQKARNRVNETQIAKWCIARTHRSLGNVDLALELQLALEKEILESGKPEDGYVAEEIAECLNLKDDAAAATPYFLKAWTLLSQDPWLTKNEGERLARLKELGTGKSR